jgi:hypothetical protein
MKATEHIKPHQGSEYIKTWSVILNEDDNGGEAVVLSADVFRNGDDEEHHTIELETNCYGTSVTTVTLGGIQNIEKLLEAVSSLAGVLRKERLDGN